MWQTESSGPVIANPAGLNLLPIKPGSATISLPGIEAEIVDSKGQKVKTGDKGIVIFKKDILIKEMAGRVPTDFTHQQYAGAEVGSNNTGELTADLSVLNFSFHLIPRIFNLINNKFFYFNTKDLYLFVYFFLIVIKD